MHENSNCIKKQTVRDDSRRKALINRLKRIEGQVRGLESMMEENAYCMDILVQSTAVSAAINSFNREILTDHIKGCVVRDIRDGKDEVVEELTAVVQRLMK